MQTVAQLLKGELSGDKRLKLQENLSEIPEEIIKLAETLEILDLTGNRLSALPETFSQLKKLKILFLSANSFTEFPSVLGLLPELEMVGFKANKINFIPPNAFPPNLRWLILTDNEIKELPSAIGNCFRLQKLMLAGNKIARLPPEMSACRKIELFRISANNLSEIPAWLFELQNLTWLAFAGNQINFLKVSQESLPEVPWKTLELKEQLGEGASGNIYKANLNNNYNIGFLKEVAVKIFKGKVTSDGLPADEMAACLAAGKHPNIVEVLGKITDHPENKQGLVLNLIPPEYKILGNPPTFETCTRDTFANGTIFTVKSLLTIAAGISSAMAHLHNRGIMHGDLYAHNILTDQHFNPLLSDFGAATIYDRTDRILAGQLEKIEIRAFGILVEDLLNHLDKSEINHELAVNLTNLKTACTQDDSAARPGFIAVCKQIAALQAALLN